MVFVLTYVLHLLIVSNIAVCQSLLLLCIRFLCELISFCFPFFFTRCRFSRPYLVNESQITLFHYSIQLDTTINDLLTRQNKRKHVRHLIADSEGSRFRSIQINLRMHREDACASYFLIVSRSHLESNTFATHSRKMHRIAQNCTTCEMTHLCRAHILEWVHPES